MLNKTFMPTAIYDFNFNVIKESIKNNYNLVKDYGSIVILTFNDNQCAISVNSMGKMDMFVQSESDLSLANENIEVIKQIFKSEINEFDLLN